MAETHENQPPATDTLLIAHVTAHLIDGTSFELYPFVDPQDVKSKVSELVEGWANSGFFCAAPVSFRGTRSSSWRRLRWRRSRTRSPPAPDELAG